MFRTNTRAVSFVRRPASLRNAPLRMDRGGRWSVLPAARPKLSVKVKARTKLRKKVHTRAKELPNRVGTDSHLTIKLKPVGLLSRIGGKLQSSTYATNNDGVATSTAGLQGVWNFGTVFSPAHLASIQGICATQAGLAGTAYLNNAMNIFVKSCHSELQLQNSSNAVVRIQLWDVINRRDAYKDAQGNALVPYEAFKQGLTDQTSTAPANNQLLLGSRPTDSTLFNQFFKVKRVTYTELAPGQVHYHRINYKIMRRINNEMFTAQNLNGIKGWSITTLMIMYGEPVGDNVGGCTVAAGRINTVSSTNYHFDFLASASATSSVTNQLATTTTGNIENLVTGATAAYAAVV